MKKRIFAILSVFAASILLVALVPGCDGTTPEETTINVEATLCGEVYPGSVSYTLSATGEDDQGGIIVPGSHTVAPGTWTIEVTASPAGTYLLGIDPSATETVAAGGNITFTVNLEEEQDASIAFVSWTINGQLVPLQNQFVPDVYFLWPGLNATIGVVWEQSVAGCEGVDVSLNESNWLAVWEIYDDADLGKPEVDLTPMLHIANNWCAVEKVPDEQGAKTEKTSQYCTVLDYPVEECWWIHYDGGPDWYLPPWVAKNGSTMWYLEDPHMTVDVHETFNLEKEVTYTKTIDWLDINWEYGEPAECTLFELYPWDETNVFYPWRTFALWTSSWVQLLGSEDVNDANDYYPGDAEMLYITVANPYHGMWY